MIFTIKQREVGKSVGGTRQLRIYEVHVDGEIVNTTHTKKQAMDYARMWSQKSPIRYVRAS